MTNPSNYTAALSVSSGEIVFIDEVTPETRDTHGGFTCLGCGAPMKARLGSARQRHFTHTAAGGCSEATQLHAAGAHALARGIREARNAGAPYELRLPARRICDGMADVSVPPCQAGTAPKACDLVPGYGAPVIGATHDGFAADVLLPSEAGGRPLLVDIVVRTSCPRETIRSGLPIIEIAVTDPEDVRDLARGLGVADEHVRIHNIDPRPVETDAVFEHCPARVTVAWPEDGSIGIAEMSGCMMRQLRREEGGAHLAIMPGSRRDVDSARFRRAAICHFRSRGVPLKSCLACEHLAGARLENGEARVRCRFDEAGDGETPDRPCESFTPLVPAGD